MLGNSYHYVSVVEHTTHFVGIRDGGRIDLIHKSDVVGDLPPVGSNAYMREDGKLVAAPKLPERAQ
jgi:hypothetical protein